MKFANGTDIRSEIGSFEGRKDKGGGRDSFIVSCRYFSTALPGCRAATFAAKISVFDSRQCRGPAGILVRRIKRCIGDKSRDGGLINRSVRAGISPGIIYPGFSVPEAEQSYTRFHDKLRVVGLIRVNDPAVIKIPLYLQFRSMAVG